MFIVNTYLYNREVLNPEHVPKRVIFKLRKTLHSGSAQNTRFEPDLPSPMMDQALLVYCHTCKNNKPVDQFKLRAKDDKYGRKGEPTTRCSPCMMKVQQRCKSKRRKRAEEGSEDPVEPNTILSIENFTALLHQQAIAGDINWSGCVSTQELPGEAEDAFKAIAVHVWEATGFRFKYGW